MTIRDEALSLLLSWYFVQYAEFNCWYEYVGVSFAG